MESPVNSCRFSFVFYYTMYYLMKNNFRFSSIKYYGIDPSPLKFVYFDYFKYLSKHRIKISYNIIDRAVVFNNEQSVTLKYGENNFGNFNVSGSNFERQLQPIQSRFEYVEIAVETIQFSEIQEIIKDNIDADAVIVKKDCKNQTDRMFVDVLDMMSECNSNYLVSCERDGSSDRDVSAYAAKGANVLTASNAGR